MYVLSFSPPFPFHLFQVFFQATAFNQDISPWNVSSVEDMQQSKSAVHVPVLYFLSIFSLLLLQTTSIVLQYLYWY